jgi:hypothetical protein
MILHEAPNMTVYWKAWLKQVVTFEKPNHLWVRFVWRDQLLEVLSMNLARKLRSKSIVKLRLGLICCSIHMAKPSDLPLKLTLGN